MPPGPRGTPLAPGWQTAAHRLKLKAGRQAIAEWELENGPLTPAELTAGWARARALLGLTR